MAVPTLRQLRYFEALARMRHFGHAAELCSVSQPALSVQIKELEEGLGILLFERGPRLVRLTSVGEDFAERVSGILRSVDELSEFARASRDGALAKLRIGVIPTIAPYLLPNVLRQLSDTYHGIDVHVRETITPRLIKALTDGLIDTAIVALPVSEPDFEEVTLFRENMVLVRPQDHATYAVPTPSDLADMRLLMLEEGHCFRDQALSFCHRGSPRAQSGLDGSSLSTLVQMVGAGLGVTLIPDMAVSVEMRSAPVSIARFATPEPERTIGMIWRKGSPLATHLGEIAEIVARSAPERV